MRCPSGGWLIQRAVAIVERQLVAHPHAPYIFVNTRDKQYTANGFRQRLARACRRAGLPPRPPYALRHYFGTKQAGNGCNQAILAQLMGHTTILTTTRYVARVPDYHQKAVNAMQEDLADLLRTGEQDGEGKQKAGELIEMRRLS